MIRDSTIKIEDLVSKDELKEFAYMYFYEGCSMMEISLWFGFTIWYARRVLKHIKKSIQKQDKDALLFKANELERKQRGRMTLAMKRRHNRILRRINAL